MSKKLTTGDKVMIGVAATIIVLPVGAFALFLGYVVKRMVDDQRARADRAAHPALIGQPGFDQIVSGAGGPPGALAGLAGVIRKAVNVPQEIAMLPFDMLRTQIVNTRRPELMSAFARSKDGERIAAIIPLTNGIPGTSPEGALVAVATARSQVASLRHTAAMQAIHGASSPSKVREVLVNHLPRTTDRIPEIMPGLRAYEVPYLPRSELPADLRARVALLATKPWSYR